MRIKHYGALLAGAVVTLCGGLGLNAMMAPAAPQAAEEGASELQDVTAVWSYANSGVMEATMALSGSSDAGTVTASEGGLEMTVIANGASFRNNGDNIQVRTGAEFRIPVISTDDVVTVVGYTGYSYYSISGGEELNNTNSYKAKYSDVERGYVSVVSTNDNNYYKSLTVEQKAPKGPATLDNQAATATFTLDLGAEGQKADFNCADYFLASKVAYGSSLTLDGKDNKSLDMTWFGVDSKKSSADESNSIRFIIQPNFGLTFTPTKVSFEMTRFGTDGGYVDVAWENPDNTVVTLAKEVKPQRDNATPNVSECSYDITGATPSEGPCALLLNLYSLDKGKRVGFRNIVIEGTLSGTEKEIPMLGSFKANDIEYSVQDIFEADGEDYKSTILIPWDSAMISENNPVTAVTPIKGEVGKITYDFVALDCENKWDWESCYVTIPVSLGEITINYIAYFHYRPGYTVTYYDTDAKTAMGSQIVEQDTPIKEFAVDYTTAQAEEGYKVRGWYVAPANGRKASVEDKVTGDTNLYARASEIETESTHKKYEFLLNDASFDPADHEAFNTENGYFHDTTHGWAFKNGDVITLLTGPKAAVSIGLCRYGYGTNIKVTDAKGNDVATVPAKSETETDGEIVSFQYEGEPGLLTLTFESTGELYIHSVKIMNNAEVNYESDGNWYFVKPADAQSLLDVIEAVSAVNSDRNAARSYIFIPDGEYDLREKVLTNISGHNISLIGQSMKNTIIRNAPHYSTEGIDKTATLMNTGTNLYMQDLTIQNALDYYAAQDAGLQGGRAVAFWDKGINTAAKNVTLLSYQDTYYSNNVNGTYYWETSDIHGTVDFFCGDGTMFMTNSTITIEKRKKDGSGECTITAPSTKAGDKFGYVFDNCTIDNKAAKYNLGRAWSNEPRCAYINTTVNDNNINSARWTANGMNVAAKSFVEYNTKDANGNVVSPSSHVMTFIKGDNVNKMETILTADQAAEYTLENVFPNWDPKALCVQIDAPQATLKDGIITWPAVEGASAYALFKNDKLAAIVTDGESYAADDADAKWEIRSANAQGGLGKAAAISGASGVEGINAEKESIYYNLQGIKVANPVKGQLYIVNGKKVVK
ncbi:MAG: hypothetical protein K2G85_00850 [Muribaculaceae bacterium]|nr:hypothetical protein [Muribaculaceae bacterium]